MYDDLILRLRDAAKMSEALAVLLPHSEGNATAKLYSEAADAIEELIRENGSLAKTVQEASEILRKRWIPVTERLPEDGVAVNIVWRNHSPVIYYQHIKDKPQTATGVCYHGRWYWWSAVVQDYLAEYGECEPDKMDTAIEVTHWMPLPEPPKEE